MPVISHSGQSDASPQHPVGSARWRMAHSPSWTETDEFIGLDLVTGKLHAAWMKNKRASGVT